ncbi:hypothetical protein AQB9606_04576 [Aquabacterium sp. CECT 9606]|nr:hypothetical protein AQB9606_04576 [Aquabacterium sp. CECT 9606]
MRRREAGQRAVATRLRQWPRWNASTGVPTPERPRCGAGGHAHSRRIAALARMRKWGSWKGRRSASGRLARPERPTRTTGVRGAKRALPHQGTARPAGLDPMAVLKGRLRLIACPARWHQRSVRANCRHRQLAVLQIRAVLSHADQAGATGLPRVKRTSPIARCVGQPPRRACARWGKARRLALRIPAPARPGRPAREIH